MNQPPPPPSSPDEHPVPQPIIVRGARAPRRHRLRWTIISLVSAVTVVVVAGGWLFYRAIAVVNTRKLDGADQKVSFIQQLTHLVTAGDQPLQGEADDRINILLLGIGGPGHEGPYLTDTMIVASVKPSTKQVAMLSIPRDLVVPIPGYDYRKINNILSFGRDQKYPGGGEALTVKVVSDVLDIPIQYYARVDFRGFVDVIDRINGIDVTVDTAFTDRQYPDNNYGYQTIRFSAGPQYMDGETALKFARSRKGNNGEGSDFARAARQQKILVAARQKLLSFGTLVNPKKVSDILGSLGSHSQTNMEVWEMMRLAKLVDNVPPDSIINEVFDDSPHGLLKADTGIGGAFILVPKDRQYDQLQFFAHNIFYIGQARRERAAVLVANASGYAGLAERMKSSLAMFGLTATKTLTLPSTVDQTVVMDVSAGQAPATLAVAGVYARAQGATSLSKWSSQTGDTAIADFLTAEAAVNNNTNASLPNANNSIRNANTSVTSAAPIDVVLILGRDQPRSSGSGTIPLFTSPKPVTPIKKPAAKPATKNSNANVSIGGSPAAARSPSPRG